MKKFLLPVLAGFFLLNPAHAKADYLSFGQKVVGGVIGGVLGRYAGRKLGRRAYYKYLGINWANRTRSVVDEDFETITMDFRWRDNGGIAGSIAGFAAGIHLFKVFKALNIIK